MHHARRQLADSHVWLRERVLPTGSMSLKSHLGQQTCSTDLGRPLLTDSTRHQEGQSWIYEAYRA